MTTRARRSGFSPRLWLAVFAAILAMAGCGKKGPLYLPDEPPAAPAPGK
jgi:predicted small lipoprotein YifL